MCAHFGRIARPKRRLQRFKKKKAHGAAVRFSPRSGIHGGVHAGPGGKERAAVRRSRGRGGEPEYGSLVPTESPTNCTIDRARTRMHVYI